MFLALVSVLMFSLPALAQVEPTPDAGPAAEVRYFDFFVVKGGPIAFGLIALSIVTIALTIEHCLSIRRATIVPPEAVRHTKALIDEKQYVEAIRFTGEDPSMLGYVLNAGLVEASNGYTAMERALEETLDERSARLFRKTEYLNIIGNVSPMIGLLGTVTGMIMLFAEIHAADTFPGARIVADRIAVALITTFWGLAVAIPALSIYAVFRNRIDVLTAECALAVEHILSVFKPSATSQKVEEVGKA
jgi:biopolymer transport protein ExbB